VPGGRLSPLLLVGVAVLTALALSRAEELRARAEAGLGRGMPAREAALARGFVLGLDEGVDPRTAEDFERAGLSHLLAVSGQNVTLLALLAMPALAALGLPLRERLVWVLALIAAYVPLAGSGPTIQRAAVMGAAGVLATLAGRRASRLYGLALAALVTLAVDPGVGSDVGWQLSFAAVLGILALAAPLRDALGPWLGSGPAARALADGLAVTVAATLATAPLIAFHFGELSTTTLLANVLALPAVAPAMWLGMLSAGAAQVPGAPLEAINAPASILLAYIAQVAAWCGRPGWAQLEVGLGGAGLAACYAGLGAAALLWRRRPALVAVPALAATAVVAVALALEAGRGGDGAPVEPPSGLRVTVFDVGQGDAILLQPRGGAPVLVDAGPPGAGLAAKLAAAGAGRLGALVVTHFQADHAGGVEEVLATVPVGRLLYGAPAARLRAAARAAGVPATQVARGAAVRSGPLRLRVLWPPRELLGSAPEDPNRLSVVVLARWGRFSALLGGDAEAEAVPLDPGPVDVLKVAHHGSEDAGLAGLLARSRPRLAVISVGARNPHGHPSPATLAALAAAGVRVLRTDRDGTVRIEMRGGRASVATEG